MEGREISDLQGQNQFGVLDEQNSSEDERYEESFMGEGQPDLQPEDLTAETGTPAAARSSVFFCVCCKVKMCVMISVQ